MRRLFAGVSILAALLIGCAGAADEAVSASPSPTTTVYRIDGLECRTDSFEISMAEIAADAVGPEDPEVAIAEFLDLPLNARFQRLSVSDRSGLRFSFADDDGLVQLLVQLTEASRGYVVVSHSYCVDRD